MSVIGNGASAIRSNLLPLGRSFFINCCSFENREKGKERRKKEGEEGKKEKRGGDVNPASRSAFELSCFQADCCKEKKERRRKEGRRERDGSA